MSTNQGFAPPDEQQTRLFKFICVEGYTGAEDELRVRTLLPRLWRGGWPKRNLDLPFKKKCSVGVVVFAKADSWCSL